MNLPIRTDAFARLHTRAMDHRHKPAAELKVATGTARVWLQGDVLVYERLRAGAWERCERDALSPEEWGDVILWCRLGYDPARATPGVYQIASGVQMVIGGPV